MVQLEKNGKIKLISQKTLTVLGGNLDGWVVVGNTTASNVKKQEQKSEKQDLTRDEMVAYLKEKGVKIHHKLGDDKVKERYDLEIKIDK